MKFSEIKKILISQGPFLMEFFAPTTALIINKSDEVDHYNLTSRDIHELMNWSKTLEFKNYKIKMLWRNVMKELIMDHNTRHYLNKK